LIENGVLNPFYIKNLGLWQLTAACGMAREAGLIKPDLKVPLDVLNIPLSHLWALYKRN